MFGDRIDGHITMLQRIVALTRDLVIAVVTILTSVVIYLGGDQSKLNSLDWARLVTAAFLVVVGPVVAFVVFRAVASFAYGILSMPLASILPDAPIPKGAFAWVALKLYRIPPRKYLRIVRQAKQHTKDLAQRHPRAYRYFLYWPIRIMDSYYASQRASSPYVFALVALVIAVVVFRRTLQPYIP